MPFQTGIVAALQRFGLDVDTVPGWQTRGSSAFNPAGVVGHHTAGPRTGDRPSLDVCVNGRGGANPLDGPLCNVFLPRGLTPVQQAPVVVAAGRANHAGAGGWRGLVGNSAVFGIEAEDDGVDGTWTEWQLWAYPRVVAGLLAYVGSDEQLYCAHRTWAPSRKIDPTGIYDAWMRDRVHTLLNPPKKEWYEMPLDAETKAELKEAARLGFIAGAETLRPVMDYVDGQYSLPNNQMSAWQADQHAAAQAKAAVAAAAAARAVAEQAVADVAVVSEKLDVVLAKLDALAPQTPPASGRG